MHLDIDKSVWKMKGLLLNNPLIQQSFETSVKVCEYDLFDLDHQTEEICLGAAKR